MEMDADMNADVDVDIDVNTDCTDIDNVDLDRE